MSDLVKPRQVVLLSSRHHFKQRLEKQATEKDNIMTIAWHTPLSHKPEMYGVAVRKSAFSWRMIKESRVFCVNFIAKELEKQAIICGTKSGEHVDKYKEAGLTMEECDLIDCGRIKEAEAWLECEVVNEVDTGDHTFFVANVMRSGGAGIRKRLFQSKTRSFTTTLE